jgi:hypothetical protein
MTVHFLISTCEQPLKKKKKKTAKTEKKMSGAEESGVENFVKSMYGYVKDAAVAFETENEGSGNAQLGEMATRCAQWTSVLAERKQQAASVREKLGDMQKFDDVAAACALPDADVAPSRFMVEDFNRAVWNVHHAGEPMRGSNAPQVPVAVAAAAESSAPKRGKKRAKREESDAAENEDEDEELQVGDQAAPIMCPLSQAVLVDPVINVKCKHTFSRRALTEFVQKETGGRRGAPNCPVVGCKAKIAIATVIPDERAAFAVEEHLRQERSEAQAVRRRAVDL